MNPTPHLIIFGASGGIATALRHRATARGWNLTAVTRNPGELSDAGEETLVVGGDGTRASDTAAAFDAATARFGLPTGVVNCIGNVGLKPLHRTSAAEFEETLRIHLMSSFHILREACLRWTSGGSAVLMSSPAARTGLPNHESIAAAKGAIEGLVRSAAATYAPKGIRVNAVAPGLTETPATTALCTPPARVISEKMHPLGRLGTPGDIASALLWLLDPEQSWVTGQILHVDGGLRHLRSLPRG